MKRTPLRKRSKKTTKWNLIYRKELARRLAEKKECELCHAPVRGNRIDGHHYSSSRANSNILRFILLCRICHNMVHESPNTARNCGLLARITGELYPKLTIVEAAEARYAELMKELNS